MSDVFNLEDFCKSLLPSEVFVGDFKEGEKVNFTINIDLSKVNGGIRDHVHFVKGSCGCTNVSIDEDMNAIVGVVDTKGKLARGSAEEEISEDVFVHFNPSAPAVYNRFGTGPLNMSRPEKPVARVQIRMVVKANIEDLKNKTASQGKVDVPWMSAKAVTTAKQEVKQPDVVYEEDGNGNLVYRHDLSPSKK